MLAELWCDQKTRDKLGDAGLAEVTAGLWAADCQTCGRALGGEPPALCVDELSGNSVNSSDRGSWRPTLLVSLWCHCPQTDPVFSKHMTIS